MIEVKNLTKYFKDFCAVDRISMNIQKGEILGLLGHAAEFDVALQFDSAQT